MPWFSKQCASAAILASVLCFQPALAVDLCFEQAGIRYGVSPLVLQAIAQHESNLNPNARNLNRNGTRDIGIMQINSSWLGFLSRYHISEIDLFDACTNIHIGAWILSSNFQRMGVSWEAIGAYNAVTHEKRARYATQIIGRLRHMLKKAM